MREMKDSGIEWVGAIPQDWQLSKIGSLYTQRNEKVSDKVYQPLSVTMQGILPQLATAAKTDDGDNRKLVRVGDFAINSRSDRRGSCGISPLDGSVSLINIILTPRTAMHPGYYNWLFHTTLFADEFYKWGHGIVADLWTTRWQEMKSITVPVPEYAEQERIAAFLDAECAEIDAVLEKTRASIEEYKKLKQAIITQAVTKGIRGDRPMKDSGIEWIGDIPAEWDVVRIKNLFDYRNERNFKPLEEVNLISLYTDKGVVQHCDLDETTGNKASNADGYKLVYENDIVVNIILCWMGAIGRSAYFGVTSPAYDVYSPKQKTNSKFYHYLFRTNGFSGDCYKVGRGIMAMRWRTYSDQFRAIKVVSPPQSEQEEIVEYLDEKCEGIDDLIAKKQQYLTEIENYKKSLIYEYVTGKKEVKTSVLAD